MHALTRRSALGRLLALVPALGLARSTSAEAQGSNLRFEIYHFGRGQFSWRLKSGNNQTIATAGEGYRTKAGCRQAIERVQRGAAGARIEDKTASG